MQGPFDHCPSFNTKRLPLPNLTILIVPRALKLSETCNVTIDQHCTTIYTTSHERAQAFISHYSWVSVNLHLDWCLLTGKRITIANVNHICRQDHEIQSHT